MRRTNESTSFKGRLPVVLIAAVTGCCFCLASPVGVSGQTQRAAGSSAERRSLGAVGPAASSAVPVIRHASSAMPAAVHPSGALNRTRSKRRSRATLADLVHTEDLSLGLGSQPVLLGTQADAVFGTAPGAETRGPRSIAYSFGSGKADAPLAKQGSAGVGPTHITHRAVNANWLGLAAIRGLSPSNTASLGTDDMDSRLLNPGSAIVPINGDGSDPAVSWQGPTGTGGAGNWSTAGDWTGRVVPNNGGGLFYAVTIGNTATASTVTLNQNAAIDSLTLGSTATLQTDNAAARSLTIGSTNAAGSLSNAGTINWGNGGTLTLDISEASAGADITETNSGNINLSGSGVSLALNDGGKGSTFSFSGGGNITLAGGSIAGAHGDETLQNMDNIIQGSGTISNLTLVNYGYVYANSPQALNITPNSGGFTNYGELDVTGAGGMTVNTGLPTTPEATWASITRATTEQ